MHASQYTQGHVMTQGRVMLLRQTYAIPYTDPSEVPTYAGRNSCLLPALFCLISSKSAKVHICTTHHRISKTGKWKQHQSVAEQQHRYSMV